MKERLMAAALGIAVLALGACERVSPEEQRARDLARALQLVNESQYPQVVGATELGYPGMPNGAMPAPQGGQWVYVPPGYATPQPMPVYPAPQPAPAPRTVYRTASTSSRSAPAPARQPQKVTHVKRDAVIGAAAGGIAGAVIDRSVKGAVIGAAAGGVLGAIVGATVDVDYR